MSHKTWYCTKNEIFVLRISSVNVTKSAVSCGFGHISGEIFNGKLYFCAVLSLEEIGPSYDQNVFCSSSPGQNIWNKVEKFSKIGQDQKTLISTYGVFFECKMLIFGRET